MQVCVLGSGSSGNATIVRVAAGAFMIDAGLGPRTVAKRMQCRDGHVDEIGSILLTHLDRDHFNPSWFRTLLAKRISLHLHEKHVYDLYRADEVFARQLHEAGLLFCFDDQAFGLRLGERVVGTVQPTVGAHDRSGVVVYRIGTESGRLGFATDVGRITGSLVTNMIDVDVLAIESNYDVQMQEGSDRPMALKDRIMGGRGHLSNEQAFDVVRKAVLQSQAAPQHVVLLHLSRQCNHPEIVQQTFAAHQQIADRICITHHATPSPWLSTNNSSTPAPPHPVSLFGQASD